MYKNIKRRILKQVSSDEEDKINTDIRSQSGIAIKPQIKRINGS